VSGPGSRTNGECSGAARERVLQAALPALASNGYSGSSLASIAAGAGLTTAGLLHHFPSKNELLVAVLAERDRLDGARLQLRGARGLTALDRLEELVAHNARNLELVRAFTVLIRKSSLTRHVAGSERRRLGDEGQGSTPPSGRLETTFSPERRSPAGEAQDY
jgi:AcrR family transcriptional regulator